MSREVNTGNLYPVACTENPVSWKISYFSNKPVASMKPDFRYKPPISGSQCIHMSRLGGYMNYIRHVIQVYSQ